MVGLLGRAGLVAALAAAAFAAGSYAGDDGLVACAKTENGQLRLVADASECLESERAVSWSAGGGGGETSFTTVTQSVPAAGGLVSATAACPVGSRVVGGGAQADPVAGGNVLADYPASDGSWTATAVLNPAAQSFVVYAVCAGAG